MKNEHVLSGLLKKRAVLMCRVEWHQAELAITAAELAKIDIAIRTEKLGHPPTVRARKGAVVRLIIDSLRTAPSPLTARQLAICHMTAQGLNPDDRPVAHTMRERIRRTLRRLKAKGVIRQVATTGPYKGWEMAA